MINSTLPVNDLLSNFNDTLVAAARLLGRSKHRQAIFEAIYRGKKQVKTTEKIAQQTKLSEKHVLTEGRKISGTLIEKVNGGYRKKNDFASHYKTILSFARNRKKLKAIPTKVFPKITTANLRVNIEFPSQAQNAKQITMDDIDSFSKAKGQSTTKVDHLLEEQVKEGFKKILGEEGEFIDHGGEKSDLFSTKAVFNGKRISLAIAFKGRGTPGKLVPGKMGKNGDQIIRLFSEPAELFLVVHVNQIDPSILAQMQAHAVGLAMGGNEIYYGIIDGNDLGRLVSVYPNAFC